MEQPKRRINKDITKYGRTRTAEACGFQDSSFPIIYCGRDLIVVDMNEAAARIDPPIHGVALEKYLSDEDASNIRALIVSKEYSETGELSIIVRIIHTRKYHYALVVARSFFGVEFAEIRLFRSHRELLSSYESVSLIFPVEPKLPEYALTDPHRGYSPAARELNGVFAYNLFANIYASAMARDKKPELFDVSTFSKRVLTELCGVMTRNSAKWKINIAPGEHLPFFMTVDRRNFVNMMAISFVVFSSISQNGECTAEIVPRGSEVDVILGTKAKKTSLIFFGDFVFPLVGEMYPECYALTKAYVFLCGLFGIPCYCVLSEDGYITLRTVLSDERVQIDYDVKHEEMYDASWINNAKGVVSLLTEEKD